MESPSRIAAFLAEHPLHLPILRDETGSIYRDHGVVGFPTSFVLDAQGRLRARALGPRPWDSEKSVAYFEGLVRGN
jgi:hypothetical protein